jgi:cytochrome c553
MKFFSPILALALPTICISLFSLSASADPSPAVAHKIEYCTACHLKNGAGLEGYVPIPRLAGQTPEYLESQIQAYLDRSRDNPASKQYMWNAVKDLTPEMVTAITEYFTKQSAPPSGGGPERLVAQGKDLYEQGVPAANIPACAACHGPQGQGNAQMAALAGQGYAYLKSSFADWRKGYRANSEPMATFAKTLTEDQIEALAQYLSRL